MGGSEPLRQPTQLIYPHGIRWVYGQAASLECGPAKTPRARKNYFRQHAQRCQAAPPRCGPSWLGRWNWGQRSSARHSAVRFDFFRLALPQLRRGSGGWCSPSSCRRAGLPVRVGSRWRWGGVRTLPRLVGWCAFNPLSLRRFPPAPGRRALLRCRAVLLSGLASQTKRLGHLTADL